jgi:hypothetical protein
LCDGFSVNTGWFTLSVHIKGVFDKPDEKFDPQKHSVLFEFHQGATLRKELESVAVEIAGMAETGVMIAQVTDMKTGSINDLLTPNRNLKIAGRRVKIAGDSEANGVYFINLNTQKETKVDPTDFVINNPSEVIVVIPTLATGTYQLEISTQYGGNSKQLLHDPRRSKFDKILTVQ